MKRLDQYIFHECAPTFLLSLTVFSFILLMQRLSDMFDLVVAKGVPVWEVGRLLALIYPAILMVVMPASLLLAVLLAMGRLSSDSEVVVMRACGVSLTQNLRPILALASLVMVACLIVSVWLAPAGRREFKRAVLDTVVSRLNVSAEEGTFTELAQGVWLYAQKIDEDAGSMEGMFVYTELGKLAGTVVTAKKGSISVAQGGFDLKLTDAEFHQPRADGSYTRTTAAASRIHLPVPIQGSEVEDLTVREMPVDLLFRKAFTESYYNAEWEFHRRLAVPVSCLMLALLGGALGSHHFRTGNSNGVFMCLFVLFLNFLLMTLADTLARRHMVPLAFAMWMPNVILSGLAAWVIVLRNREGSFSVETILALGIAKIRERLHKGERAA